MFFNILYSNALYLSKSHFLVIYVITEQYNFNSAVNYTYNLIYILNLKYKIKKCINKYTYGHYCRSKIINSKKKKSLISRQIKFSILISFK